MKILHIIYWFDFLLVHKSIGDMFFTFIGVEMGMLPK